MMHRKDTQRRELAQFVRNMKVFDLHKQMVENNIYRAFIVYENGEFTLSHPKILKPLQAFFELSQDFSNHEGVFIGREDELETLFFAFVHDTRRGLAQGGLRFSKYNTLADLLVDGLRLSQGMTRKNALAGLWWGGGKGIMSFPPDIDSTEQLKVGTETRRKYFEAYGRFIASLGGVYYTAEDVGTNTEDMRALLSQNRFTTCIPAETGGSGNPSPFTARGVFKAMQAAWKVISGTDDLRGVKVSVQGAGNVGAPLIRYLYEVGAEIWFCDMSETRIKELLTEMPELHLVSNDEIFDLDVDVFAPCAIGAQVNSQTIPRLKVKLVCGAANNILKEPEADALRLKEKGIGFVPDFVCNRMGIINCADEWLGYLTEDIRVAAEKVYPDTLRVFKYAKNRSVTTMQASKDLADIAASELHPLIQHRGRRIIDNLINSGWHKSKAGEKISQKLSELAFIPSLDEVQIRVGWEKESKFRGNAYTVAGSPISAASSPDLSGFLSATLMDVKARSVDVVTGNRAKRVIGSNHGGLSLQIAIEQLIPYERDEVGYSRFLELCHDLHKANDEEIRKQLHKAGIGFDQNTWLNPVGERGRKSVRKLYNFLNDSKLVIKQKSLQNYCTHSKSVIVSSDTVRSKLLCEERYTINFKTKENEVIETKSFFPEYILGATALAVSPSGKYANLTGKTVFNLSTNKEIPVISSDKINTEAEFITPIHNPDDQKIARENNVCEENSLFDENGYLIVKGYEGLSREEARAKVIEKFGLDAVVEKGNWEADVLRCVNSENILITQYSDQTFVKLEEAKELLLKAIEENKVEFSHKNWKKMVIDYLSKIDSWCISRQYWWGNRIPSEKQIKDVFSTWFSLTAMSLEGAGWLENPRIDPIDEVFVSQDYLLKWVVPSLLMSILIAGRPVFKKVTVHGSLNIIERVLRKVEGIDNTANDEDRFIYSTVKRPMQKRLGNVVEPADLIKRFGADTLRLAYLLCLSDDYQQDITFSQDKFNYAQQMLYKMDSKITNIVSMIKKADIKDSNTTERDQEIIKILDSISEEVKWNYANSKFLGSAKYLTVMIEYLTDYCNKVAQDYKETNSIGSARATLQELMEKMKAVFEPICPYHFEKLDRWVKAQLRY